MPKRVGRLTWVDDGEPYVEVKLDAIAIEYLLMFLPEKEKTAEQLRQAAADIAKSKEVA